MEYGEPWSNKNGFIENRDGVGIDGTRQSDTRAVACVNSLSGIPDSWLADRAAAKAMLAWELRNNFGYCYTPEYSHETVQGLSCGTFDEEIPSVATQHQIIQAALRIRSRGADFGELNELIDSFKEE